METDDLLTVPEVAALLGIAQTTVHNAISNGNLPHVHKYGRRLVARSAALEYKERAQPDGAPKRGRPRLRTAS